MYLVAKGSGEGDGTYQIWSSGSDDDEMRNPTHGAMYAKYDEGSEDEEKVPEDALFLLQQTSLQ